MGLSSQKRAEANFHCLVRQKPVAATPEERVRQGFIRHLVEERGFPLAHIAVELSLKEMPHLSLHPPQLLRRADILCYTPHGLPLLLVECKANRLDQKAKNQLIGYNCFVKAHYIALVNADSYQVISSQGEKVTQLDYMFLCTGV
jgi:hypothetical protein